MSRPSTVDELPEEIRSEIGRLRIQGATLDRILDHLRKLTITDISRSALGRHVKKMEVVGERIRRSRQMAEVVVRELGDAPASKSAQLNIEMVHSLLFDLFNADGEIDEGGKAALAGNPEGMMMLAKTLDHLTRASKTDVEFVAKVEARAADKAKKEAAAVIDQVVAEKGLTGEDGDRHQGAYLRGEGSVMGWMEVERTPEALRKALQDKGVELFAEAVRHLDGVLMVRKTSIAEPPSPCRAG